MIFHCNKFSLDALLAVMAARTAQLEILKTQFYDLSVTEKIWQQMITDKTINCYLQKIDSQNGILNLSEFCLPEQIIVRLDVRSCDWCFGTCISGLEHSHYVCLIVKHE